MMRPGGPHNPHSPDNSTRVFDTVGVLCNPLSGRVKRKPAIRALSAALPAVRYREGSNAAEFQQILDEFADSNIQLLLVIAGDGTFHAVLSYLFANKIFTRLPLLCPIPAGTTNMTAHDLGIAGSPLKVLHSLAAVLADSSMGRLTERPVLKILRGGGRPLYGMFFATGLIVAGVKFFRDKIQQTGLTGEGASGLVMLRYLVSLLFHRTPHGHAASLRADHIALPGTHYLTVFASTLERLLIGTRPYWGDEALPIHATMVRQSPKGLFYALPAALAGYGRRLQQSNGYYSQNLHTLTLAMQGEFVVDGEIYRADNDTGELEITATDTIQILVPQS